MVLDDLLEIEHREGLAEGRDEIIAKYLTKNPNLNEAADLFDLPPDLIGKIAT